LIAIEEEIGAVSVSEAGDRRDIGAKPVDKRDLGKGHDGRLFVDGAFVIRGVTAFEESNVRAAWLLGEKDLAHGWEFVFAHDDVAAALFEWNGVGDSVDAGGSAGNDGDLIWMGIDELSELDAQAFVSVDPIVPGRGRGAPTFEIRAHAGFGGVAERALGTVVEVCFLPEDRETGAELRESLFGEHG